MMGYHDNGTWGGGDWLAMGGMMLLFWALAIAVVVWAVRSVRTGVQDPDTARENPAGPDDILAERYARGEIDEDEFARRRQLLRTTSGSGTRPRSTS